MLQTLQSCSRLLLRRNLLYGLDEHSLFTRSMIEQNTPFLGEKVYGRRGIQVQMGMKQDPEWGEEVGEEILVLLFGHVTLG